jgi:ketosteroid isomerase-like protein
MAIDRTAETQDVARRYFAAWTSRDGKTVASLLSDDFQFVGGERVLGREAFLSAGAFPADAETKMIAEAYQSEVGFQLYDSTRNGRSVRIVECLRVRGGRIVSSTSVTDMTAFLSFVQG